MVSKLILWFSLISVLFIGLLGFGLYLTLLISLILFLCGVLTILYFTYDDKNIFPMDLNSLDDPLQQLNLNVQIPKVLAYFQSTAPPTKFDQRISGGDAVDAALNEIISVIIKDFVSVWYEILTTDNELTQHLIKKLAITTGANLATRMKMVDWVALLSSKFPDEMATHLKIFKQSQVRLKHLQLVNSKNLTNGNPRVSPKRSEDKKTHRRNKSDTDLGGSDMQTYGKSKFYGSSEQLNGRTLKDLFFDLECKKENRLICRDIFCTDDEKEHELLCEIAEALIYIVVPKDIWDCHGTKLILIDLLVGIVFKPLLNLLSDPDNINRIIIKKCCRDSILPSDIFVMVIRCSEDAEELDAILELVKKELQKLHSKDTAGGCELPIRQQLSSLQYLIQTIQARRATLTSQQDITNSNNQEKVSVEVSRSLEFLSATTAWRSNAQYLMEIDLIEADSSQTSKAVIENLRSTALAICDTYLAPSKPTVLGLPQNCYADLVRKITTEDDAFTTNPITCFDDIQKAVYEALGETQEWQSVYMHDEDGNTDRRDNQENCNSRKCSAKCKKLMKYCIHQLPKFFLKTKYKHDFPNKSFTFPRISPPHTLPNFKNHTLPKCKTFVTGDVLTIPGTARHNRSRSDIVGSLKITDSQANSLSSLNNLSMSHSEINRLADGNVSLSASIIETALVQDKKRTFGIYAISVTRLSDNTKWHIYRRYSDFYDLYCAIKERWPNLGQLAFPGKRTFQNTSRIVLESRKKSLNEYLNRLFSLAKEPRYAALMSEAYLGGFLSKDMQSEKHTSKIDALLVSSLRAGMRTLKNMPDQLVNTVDGVMDGLSKVFQPKMHEGSESKMETDDHAEADENASLKLFEEVLGLRGLRRHLLAPLRSLIADRIEKKLFDFVSTVISSRSIMQYLNTLKSWLINRGNQNYGIRDSATKARTRVAAKVALLAACSDELRPVSGADAARRGLLTLFDMLQTQSINRRLLYVLLEAILVELFPDYKIQELFRKIYSTSPRTVRKPVK